MLKKRPHYAMTANVFKEDITTVLKAGMNGHIGKPIQFEKVVSVIKQVQLKKEQRIE